MLVRSLLSWFLLFTLLAAPRYPAAAEHARPYTSFGGAHWRLQTTHGKIVAVCTASPGPDTAKDAKGRVTHIRGAGGKTVERFVYNSAGDLVEHVDASGRTRFTYDRKSGDITWVTEAGGDRIAVTSD